jgi:membrane protease YdiL (CAAX protease family)
VNESTASSHADWRALHGLLVFALIAGATFFPAFRVWPLIWFVPLAAYAVLVALLPPLRANFRPWRFGRVTRPAVLATMGIALVSCSALVAFHVFVHPDVRAYGTFLPVSTLGGVLAVGVLFSVFNALFEEIIFRGILFDAVESQWGAWGAVVATAFLFGYGHLRGYPPGLFGAVLAGVYGLGLGWLRLFTAGLGLSVIAHIAADATIFTIIARSGVL